MKIFLVRHGETDWNLKGKIQGNTDIELNKTGIKQAYELSNKMLEKNYKFSKIYSSPQKRALQTAKILSENTNIECIVVDKLKEMNLGKWEGLAWSEVRENYPLEYKEWFVKRRYTKTPNGESYEEMLERVLDSLYKIIDDNSDNIVIVTHSAVIMSLQCYITNTDFDKMTKFRTDNASILEIDSDLLIKLKESNLRN
ncbi:MAG: alpha-ribazole phosphatase [Clostridium sp.]|uniref:alpha-ribazole phosphatase n=1 Tax=Clostridium sp. TaxID=1506 RepID=UPI0025C480F2|nr:alpha-ribazole phosphatase [Clostridium sp.]MCI6691780.1 alpha-ribazole phosphatase [Clostridium sp.]MDY2631008.1 alpha-ribazole phosphatase [Clostridium sp.]MDY6226307.1 alpha-ribazole phosphatase [Clostridium sp.]